jgi:hypothetical protein
MAMTDTSSAAGSVRSRLNISFPSTLNAALP